LPQIIEDMSSIKVLTVVEALARIVGLLSDIERLAIGAEALLLKAKFLGRPAVIKWRFPKPYMPPELDAEFRRIRTLIEFKSLTKAREIGVPVPKPMLLFEDEGVLIMEFIEGSILRSIVDTLAEDELCRICRLVGLYAGKLHSVGISHGDLTTSNVIVGSDGNVYLIDFGLANLGSKFKDFAIDVHIFFRAAESTHYMREQTVKNCFIEGYRDALGVKAQHVLKLVEELRLSGRYKAERKLRSVWRS